MKDKKELLRYIFVGIITTGINFMIYYFFVHVVEMHYIGANVIAWIGAVLFAYDSNKEYVFRKGNDYDLKELISFFSLRFITLLIESFLLYILVSILMLNDLISKIAVSIFTVLANYVFCKYMIFRKEDCNE